MGLSAASHMPRRDALSYVLDHMGNAPSPTFFRHMDLLPPSAAKAPGGDAPKISGTLPRQSRH